MAENDDEQQSLSTRVGIVEGDITTIKSALHRMAQAIERISFKIDDQSLVDGMYRIGRDCLSINFPPPAPPSSRNPHPQLPPQQFPPHDHRNNHDNHHHHHDVLYEIFTMKIFTARKN